jgi:hypothetical protein
MHQGFCEKLLKGGLLESSFLRKWRKERGTIWQSQISFFRGTLFLKELLKLSQTKFRFVFKNHFAFVIKGFWGNCLKISRKHFHAPKIFVKQVWKPVGKSLFFNKGF